MAIFILTVASLLACVQPAERIFRNVDWYGLRTTELAEAEKALGVKAGEAAVFDREAATERLRSLEGVADAVVIQMLAPGNETLLVGIEEVGAPKLQLRPEPTGSERLPDGFVATYEACLEASFEGLKRGVADEEHVEGYALSKYRKARARELELRDLARAHAELLPRVLGQSADAKHREVAASAIAYLIDKPVVAASLERAMTDADSGVRNNATRALAVLADWANSQEDFRLDLDPTPILAMLESLEWTDRNKATALLYHLTESRDEALMAAVREKSIPALEEMALWSLTGYAYPALMTLGRIAGMDDNELASGPDGRSPERLAARRTWIREIASKARAPH